MIHDRCSTCEFSAHAESRTEPPMERLLGRTGSFTSTLPLLATSRMCTRGYGTAVSPGSA